jgi:hypothetical protein
MDHTWAAYQLREFRDLIDIQSRLDTYMQTGWPDDEQTADYDALIENYGSRRDLADRLVSLDPSRET